MAILEARLVSAKKEYKTDEQVPLQFELANKGEQDLYVLTWYTPLEGLWSDCIAVLRDGERVSYDGPLAKRGNPSAEDYVLIRAGDTASTEVVLNYAYNVAQPGQYDVSLDTEVKDSFPVDSVTDLNAKIAEASSEQTPEPLQKTGTQFIVVPGEGKLKTRGQEARETEMSKRGSEESNGEAAQKKAGAKDPLFDGGDATKQSQTKQAHFDGYNLTKEALGALANDPNYKEWFGVHTDPRFNKVKDNYQKIKDGMETKTFTYNLTGTGCKPNVYAYTFKGTTTVWMCDLFWKAPATGTDSKAGTVVHELGHAIALLDDITYGQTNCRKLATDDPDKAIRNADNHEYFAKG